jgi:transcriptional regulator with AAA-type ATPase domain
MVEKPARGSPFLSVACFMIQHGRYSDEALTWIQEKLRIYLDRQLTNQQLRQLIANEMSSATRTWKVARPTDTAALPKIAWSMTIVDLVPSAQDSEQYCEQVKQWARITLQHMKSLR